MNDDQQPGTLATAGWHRFCGCSRNDTPARAPRRRQKRETMATQARTRTGRARRAPTPPDNGNGNWRRASGRMSPSPQYATLGKQVQRFGTLRDLPIGLPDKARGDSCRAAERDPRRQMILYALYKKHHWHVAGPTFYQLHLLFDKHAEEQLELVDLLAERVQSLGGIAVGDPRHAAELTTIERAPDGAEDVPRMITRLLQAHETIIGRSARRSTRPRRARTGGPTTC